MKNSSALALFLLHVYALAFASGQTFGDPPGGNNGPSGQAGCSADNECDPVMCFAAPCPQMVCVDGVCQLEDNPPNPECVQDSDCDNAAFVCMDGLCQADDNAITNEEGGLISCGPSLCQPNERCCNPSCGYCVAPGGVCTEEFCLPAEDDNNVVGNEDGREQATGSGFPCNATSGCPGIQCFAAPCDQYICNASLGECFLTGENCGDQTCSIGQVCCNDSCGICTERGGVCTQQICDSGANNASVSNTGLSSPSVSATSGSNTRNSNETTADDDGDELTADEGTEEDNQDEYPEYPKEVEEAPTLFSHSTRVIALNGFLSGAAMILCLFFL